MSLAGSTKGAVTSHYDFSGHMWLKIQLKPSNSCISSTEALTDNLLIHIPDLQQIPVHAIALAAPAIEHTENYVLDHLELPIPLDLKEVPVTKEGNALSFTVGRYLNLGSAGSVNITIPIAGVIDEGNHLTLNASGMNIQIVAGPHHVLVNQTKNISATGHGDIQSASSSSSPGEPITASPTQTHPPFVINADVKVGNWGCLHRRAKMGSATVTLSDWTLTPVPVIESAPPVSSDKGKEKVTT